jgi:small subunit ribosomal protein S17
MTESQSTPAPAKRGTRQTETGKVVSAKAKKTVTVKVERRFSHVELGKVQRKSVKFMAHDEKSECGVGDTVEIRETRPLSARKRWEVLRIVSKAR